MYAVLGRLFLVIYLIGIGSKLQQAQDKGEWPYGPWKSASDEASPAQASANDSVDKEKPNV